MQYNITDPFCLSSLLLRNVLARHPITDTSTMNWCSQYQKDNWLQVHLRLNFGHNVRIHTHTLTSASWSH